MQIGRYILENGQSVPCVDLMKWAQWMEDNHGNRHVGDDAINGYRISTVFLGLDHAHEGGPPLVYETMIFALDEGREMTFDHYQERYSTRSQAEKGHARACQMVRDKTKPKQEK